MSYCRDVRDGKPCRRGETIRRSTTVLFSLLYQQPRHALEHISSLLIHGVEETFTEYAAELVTISINCDLTFALFNRDNCRLLNM
jgi:hypothetical protein